MVFELLIYVIIIAFVLEFFDASAGMGYGTLTPILLLMGFDVLDVISAVILTSAVLSLFAGFLHHGFENIDFLKAKNIKVTLTLIGFGILAISLGALIAVNIPETFLKVYIAILVSAIGISILKKKKKKHKFSWKKLVAFGSIASFNKGISGGGYGPVLSGGQILSGVKSRQAVGITALSEGIVSTVGFFIFIFVTGHANLNWSLTISLLIGGFLSTPLAAYFVNRFHPKKLKYLIGITSIVLGIMILLKIIF